METATQAQLEKLGEQLHEATVSLTQTTTVLRQHVQEQRAMNKRLEVAASDVEGRVRELEQWRQRVDVRVPSNLLSGEEIDRRFDELDQDIVETKQLLGGMSIKVDGITKQLARWAGIGTAAFFVLQVILKWVFE